MSLSKEEACQRIAEKLLEDYKVKHPKLYAELLAHILVTGEAPKTMRLYWDSKAEDLKLEILA